jgi:hypothetical protein
MRFENRKDIAELVGITAIVLSLIFVGLELRQARQVAVGESLTSSFAAQNEIRELIVSHADVWQKACTGDPLDVGSRIIAGKIFDAWADFVIRDYMLKDIGLFQSDAAGQRVIEDVAAQMWVYPGLKQLSISRGNWHQGAKTTRRDSGLVSSYSEAIFAKLKELESSGQSPEMDLAWCGTT